MPHQATVTAPTGPARALTSQVLLGVTRVDMDLNDKILQIYQDPAQSTMVKEFDLNGVTTLTCTITGGNYAFVMS